MPHMIKTMAAALAVVLASNVSATAADLYEPAPVAKNPFHGFFIGVHGGYGWADTKGEWGSLYEDQFACGALCPAGGDIDYDQKGPVVGGQAGFNYVMESGFLFGGAVSGSWGNIQGTDESEDGPSASAYERTIDGIGLAEGRVGFATDMFMLYASGGLAVAHHSVDTCTGVFYAAPSTGCFNWDEMSNGWTVGGGASVMVMENVSLNASYNYIKLDDARSGYSGPMSAGAYLTGVTETDMEVNLFKVGVDYHF